MFRISDIFDKYKEEKEKSGSQYRNKNMEGKSSQKAVNIKVSSVLKKELEKTDSANISKLYEEAVAKVKEIYRLDFELKSGLISEITAFVERLIDLASLNNKELLKLFLADYAQMKDFLYYHVINVCIIAIEIGLGLGYERAKLIELGSAGFFHDIGMIKYLDLINLPRVFNKEEYARLKQHPNTGIEILSRFSKEMPSYIFDVVRQEHERVDGSGYPLGLKDGEFSEFSKIVGLADFYEAKLHSRPYRRKFSPLETIKTILKDKTAFNYKLIKGLIEKVGIFPVGALVRLNTKEIGLVLKYNSKLPLRPVVNILIDADGKELNPPRRIDLVENAVFYIEECLEYAFPHQ